MSRLRNQRLYVMVTEEEKEAVKQKMNKLGMTNLGEFVRLALTVNPIVSVDMRGLNKLLYELNKIGTNINQIAKVANTSKNIYQSDIDEIKDYLRKINGFIETVGESLNGVR
ncbi:MAG: MobC family plasmid mobilization relaxosome protein [Clostridiales bacterium]|nr:MobC family plasmid mobilization relaxosome protein [Clostridiales bacterium]